MDAHVDYFVSVIFSSLQLGPDLCKGLESVFHVFHGVGGSRNDPENDHPLRNYRVNDYRTEDSVIFPEVYSHLRSLGNAAFDGYRGNACFRRSDIETEVAESSLKGAGHRKEFLAQLVTLCAADP